MCTCGSSQVIGTVDVTWSFNSTQQSELAPSPTDSACVPEMLFTVSARRSPRRSPRRRPHLSDRSQLVSLGSLGLAVLSGAQFVLGDLAVFILVLVVEHVPDDAVGVDPRTETTFALFDLELDEG